LHLLFLGCQFYQRPLPRDTGSHRIEGVVDSSFLRFTGVYACLVCPLPIGPQLVRRVGVIAIRFHAGGRTGRETASQFFTLRAVVMDGFSFFVSTIRRNRAGAWGGGGYDAVGGAKAATGEGERGRGDGGAAGGGGGGLGGERYSQGQTVEYQSSAGWVAATVQRDSGGPKLDLGELLLLALLEFLLVLVLLLLVLLLPLLLTLPPFFLSLR